MSSTRTICLPTCRDGLCSVARNRITSSWLFYVFHCFFFFFSSRRRHTRFDCDWSSDVCSSDLVAIPQDFPPFGSLGTDLKLQGYDIDMAALVAQELGVKVELVPVTSTNRIPFQIGRASCRERV